MDLNLQVRREEPPHNEIISYIHFQFVFLNDAHHVSELMREGMRNSKFYWSGLKILNHFSNFKGLKNNGNYSYLDCL